MAKARKPRSGTMQFWHRKRAKRPYARIRSWPNNKNVKLLGFPGYKVGMTHLMVTDNKATSMTKGQEISIPATIIECPPIKIASIVFYKKTPYGSIVSTKITQQKLDKELSRKIKLPKKQGKKLDEIKTEDFDDLKILIYTQPKLTTIGKKKPELFEIALGGKKEDKLNWAKEHFEKEITITEALKEGQIVDSRGITIGKGFQGPVKRFGVSLRSHKSEKTIRGPANLGAWTANRSWTVAHAGQTGYHQRTELNKWILKIGTDPKEINTPSGFKRYGIIKNNYLLIKGSIQGPTKRLIMLTEPQRPNRKIPTEAPTIN